MKNISKTSCILILAISLFSMMSCNKTKLQIERSFPFEVKVMPVSKDITFGSTVEIRLHIISSGNYTETKYCLRYFQFEGVGELRYYDESPYQPNDLYSLNEKEFRLYYTSASSVGQSFDVWISDNFGNEQQLSFQFANKE